MAATMRVIVSGRVQGVYFRAWTRDRAREAGVRGFVRNLPSGQVEALAQGNREALDQLLAGVRQGPPMSRVDDVAVEWIDQPATYDDFQITY